MLGLSPGEFWDMDPKKLVPYEKAYRKNCEIRLQEADTASWLNGIYVSYAIAASFSSKSDYPPSPFYAQHKEDTAEDKRDSLLFEAYALAFNKEFGAAGSGHNIQGPSDVNS